MFTRADIPPLSIAAAVAVVAGAGLGAWAGPPSHLAEPVFRGDVQPVYDDDPNLAQYKQMMAELGPAPLYRIVDYPPPAPLPALPDEGAILEAQLAQEQAAADAQARAWEADRTAWLEARRQAQQAQVALPVAYAEPERVTAAEAPAAAQPEPAPAPG